MDNRLLSSYFFFCNEIGKFLLRKIGKKFFFGNYEYPIESNGESIFGGLLKLR